MKTLPLSSALAALVLLGACTKAPAVSSLPGGEAAVQAAVSEEGMLLLTLAPEGPYTKADQSAVSANRTETRISSVQVFIFNADGTKKETDLYREFTGDSDSRTLTLTSLTGMKKIWAVVNAPKLLVSSETALLTSVSDLGDPKGNGPTRGLTMVGCANRTSADNTVPLAAGTTEVRKYSLTDASSLTTVTIPVYRLAARVNLQNVTVNFDGTYLEGHTFAIKEIYLKNVVNSVYFSGASPDLSSEQEYWSNRIAGAPSYSGRYQTDRAGNSIAWHVSDGKDGSADLFAWSAAETADGTKALDRYYYVYPNPFSAAANPTSGTWSPRRTSLVIHAVVNGSQVANRNTYYVFPLAQAENITADSANQVAQIQPNFTYTVKNITITMLGKDNDNDDSIPESGKVTVTVNTSAWGPNVDITYEI